MAREGAFVHLPQLRERLTPAAQSRLRVTPEVLAAWDERARRAGHPPDWRLSNEAIEASRRATLGQLRPGEDLWIYAYGSLMWDPSFHFSEIRRASLEGYARRFSYRSSLGRGTPERPGLMLTLEKGAGRCQGLAFRIDAAIADAESQILWRREMVRGGYVPTLVPLATSHGEVTGIVFACNTAHPDYLGGLPLAEKAAVIARAAGFNGSNRAYLEQLASLLDCVQAEDEYVSELLAQVRALVA